MTGIGMPISQASAPFMGWSFPLGRRANAGSKRTVPGEPPAGRAVPPGTRGRPMTDTPPRTPDGRYIVVRGRLWRAANPHLAEAERARLVRDLMAARRAVRDAKGNPERLAEARARVDAAKRGLGERGPVWWDDGAPDLNRRMVAGTVYAGWWNRMKVDQANFSLDK